MSSATVYECDKKLTVERQLNGYLCWACVVIAVCKYYGVASETQNGLQGLYPEKQKGNSPHVVLRDRYHFTYEDLLDIPTVDIDKIKETVAAVKNKLAAVAQGPLLAGLQSTTGNWVTGPDGTLTLLQHAVVICKFDMGSNKVTFKDPARGIRGQEAKEFTVTVDDLVNGFTYATREQFGKDAKEKVDMDEVKMRMYVLRSFSFKM